jgi:hypothetical protein
MLKAKEKKYFVSWISTTEFKVGNFMAESKLTGEKLIRRMVDIARTSYCPDAVILSINAIPN